MSKEGRKIKKIDWAKFTNFGYRRSREDLSELCSKVSRSKLEKVFNNYDQAGLCPIHWASINNRSDMIEFLIDNGSPMAIKCRNKLFSDGTALHLAAMNGSIEAASMLLLKADTKATRSEFRKLSLTDNQQNQPANESKKIDSFDAKAWLKERDSDGQTPLMRSAAPKSKRLDTIRDLLRKNLWSLSGRPAEMALFLINKGADWRETEPIYNMNLMHLAIVNDYDDIVNMLLVIDRQLLTIPAKITNTQIEASKLVPKSASPQSNFESISLNSSGNSSSESSSPDSSPNSSNESLLDRETQAKELLEKGLTPLELAIVYGRVSVIQLFWFVRSEESEKRHKSELRAVLSRACWSSKSELTKTVRVAFLKIILITDLIILTLFWLPLDGIFILSYCLTLALVIRMMFSNPGYLNENTQDYLNEVSKLVRRTISADSSQIKDGTVIEMTTGIETNGGEVTERVRLLCHKCHCMRKHRSKHCNYCNRCIQDFDHHCIYLSCCIGRKNRLDFLILLIMISLTATYGSIVYRKMHFNMDAWQLFGFVWIFKWIVIGILSSLLILKRACQGVTMYENLRSKRIRKIFGSEGTPENISKSHRIYSIKKGSYWRYSPNRFVTGDLKREKIIKNLQEFANYISIEDYLLSLISFNTNMNGTR